MGDLWILLMKNIKFIFTCFCLGSTKYVWATSNILFKRLDNSEDEGFALVTGFILAVVSTFSGYSNSYSNLMVDGFPSWNNTFILIIKTLNFIFNVQKFYYFNITIIHQLLKLI